VKVVDGAAEEVRYPFERSTPSTPLALFSARTALLPGTLAPEPLAIAAATTFAERKTPRRRIYVV
jgi:hypothetical protein